MADETTVFDTSKKAVAKALRQKATDLKKKGDNDGSAALEAFADKLAPKNVGPKDKVAALEAELAALKAKYEPGTNPVDPAGEATILNEVPPLIQG